MIGARKRSDYDHLANQFDDLVADFDVILEDGTSEHELKVTVTKLAIVAAAIAHSATPEAFRIAGD